MRSIISVSVKFLRSYLRRGLAAGAIMLASGPAAGAETTPDAPPLLIENVRVIDGLGGDPLENRDILIIDGRIAEIARHGRLEAPAGAKVIPGAGRTVMPGLIEGHSHLLVNPLGGEFPIFEMEKPLRANLYAGVTTLSDLGSRLEPATELRDAVGAGRIIGPRVHTVGDVFEEASERDNFLTPRALSRMADYVNLLDMHEARGVKTIKAYVMIPLVRMQQLATEAHKRGMRVVADVGAWIGTTAYMRAGVDGFAHVAFTHKLTTEEIAEAKRQGVWSIGTASIVHQLRERTNRILSEGTGVLDDPLVAPFYSADEIARMRDPAFTREIIAAFMTSAQTGYGEAFFDNFESWPDYVLDNVKALIKAGVLVGLGTDPLFPGMFHGEAMHYEMELWARSGIPNLTVIRSATHNNARILGIDDEIGAIRPGMVADLLVLDGDPARNIRDTRNIVAVIKGGAIIDRAALPPYPPKDTEQESGQP